MSLKQIREAIISTYEHFNFQDYDPEKVRREHSATVLKRIGNLSSEGKQYFDGLLGSAKDKSMTVLNKPKKEKAKKKESGFKIKRSEIGRVKGSQPTSNQILQLSEYKEQVEKAKKALEKEKDEIKKMKEMDKEKYLAALYRKTKLNIEEDLELVKKRKKLIDDKYDSMLKQKTDLGVKINAWKDKINELELLNKANTSKNNTKEDKQKRRDEINDLKDKIKQYSDEKEDDIDKLKEEELQELEEEEKKLALKLRKANKVKPDDDKALVKYMLKELGVKEEMLDENLASIKEKVEEQLLDKAEVRSEIAVEQIPEEIKQLPNYNEIFDNIDVDNFVRSDITIKDDQKSNEDSEKQKIDEGKVNDFLDSLALKGNKVTYKDQLLEAASKLKPVKPGDIIPKRDYGVSVLDIVKNNPAFVERMIKLNPQDYDEIGYVDSEWDLDELKEARKPTNNFKQELDRTMENELANNFRQKAIKKDVFDDFSQDLFVKNMIEEERPQFVPEVVGVVPPAPSIPESDIPKAFAFNQSSFSPAYFNEPPDGEQLQKGNGVCGGYSWWGGSSRIGGMIPMDMQYAVCKQYGGFVPARVIKDIMIQPYVNKSIRQITAAGGNIIDIAKGVGNLLKNMKKR